MQTCVEAWVIVDLTRSVRPESRHRVTFVTSYTCYICYTNTLLLTVYEVASQNPACSYIVHWDADLHLATKCKTTRWQLTTLFVFKSNMSLPAYSSTDKKLKKTGWNNHLLIPSISIPPCLFESVALLPGSEIRYDDNGTPALLRFESQRRVTA